MFLDSITFLFLSLQQILISNLFKYLKNQADFCQEVYVNFSRLIFLIL